jgi:hypothetical protein
VRLICVKIWCSCRKSRSVSSSTFWLRRVVQRFAAILIWSRIVSINSFDEFIDLDLILGLFWFIFCGENLSFDRRRVHCVAWLLSHPPFPIRQADVDVV